MKSKQINEYQLITKYEICASSGTIGPKRQQGDGQVPEGFYYIDRFNPNSNFHLSLGVNYPNESDKKLGKKNLGGDIFIHGSCVTIGCMPITDECIKELYVLAVEAKTQGQEFIPVYIFPTRLTDKKITQLAIEYAQNQALLDFWKNLKTGYDFFDRNHKIPKVTINKTGEYIFQKI